MAWERLKKKYDQTPIGQVILVWDQPEGVSADLIIVDDLDPYRDFQFDEREARRMMKKTSKEMDWTKVRWG